MKCEDVLTEGVVSGGGDLAAASCVVGDQFDRCVSDTGCDLRTTIRKGWVRVCVPAMRTL